MKVVKVSTFVLSGQSQAYSAISGLPIPFESFHGNVAVITAGKPEIFHTVPGNERTWQYMGNSNTLNIQWE